jgi:hypothetical protein
MSKGVVLLHDNAGPHTAAHAVETLRKPKFDVMAHLSYSPDLLPFVWSIQRGLKWPSIHLGPKSGGSSASVARCLVEIVIFHRGHTETCATQD